MRFHITCQLCVIALALPVSLRAEEPAAAPAATAAPAAPDKQKNQWLFTTHWENDGTVLKPNHNTDRYYTNGLVFSFTVRDAAPANLVGEIWGNESFSGAGTHQAAGAALGHHIYTANNIALANPPLNDHPYAGYVYLAGFLERSNADTLDHFEVNIGVVGPASQADDIQTGIHDFFDEQEPLGWDTQLGDEPVVQFYLRKKWKFGDKPIVRGLLDPQPAGDEPVWSPVQVQLIPQVGVALGLAHRHLEGGALLRVGFNLPDDFGPSRIADLTATGFSSPGLPTLYGFLRVGGRIVEHNLFIEGSNFEKSRSAEAETFVGEAQAGIGFSCRWSCADLHLTYSQTVLTREFDGQQGTHGFGALTFGVRVQF